MKNYDEFKCVWDHWSASDMSLTLFSTMNELHETNKIIIDLLLLLKFCIINKLIHGCLEIWNFSSPVQLLNTQREICYLCMSIRYACVKITLSSVSDACFSVGLLAKIPLSSVSDACFSMSYAACHFSFVLFPISKFLFSFSGRKVRVLCSSKGLPHQDIFLWDFYLEVNKDSKQVSV